MSTFLVVKSSMIWRRRVAVFTKEGGRRVKELLVSEALAKPVSNSPTGVNSKNSHVSCPWSHQ